jgi:capsid protein
MVDFAPPPAEASALVSGDSATKFDYDAVQSSNRRKQQTTAKKKHADRILTPPKRAKAEKITEDLLKNAPLVKWAIERHLDSTTQFYFEADDKLPEPVANRILALLKWHGRKENFDAARRHSRDDAMRLFEKEKLLNGDAGFIKIGRKGSQAYGKTQLVEGSRIFKPMGYKGPYADKFTDHGLQLDRYGGVESYMICKYNDRGDRLEFDQRILANQMIFSGYFDRYSQTRGVSPILTAANGFLDIGEANEHILLKIKIHSLFGYAVTRELLDDSGVDGLSSTSTPESDSDPHDESTGGGDVTQEVDFSKGPVSLDLSPGEKVQLIESETPPESVKAYMELAIRCALLGLGIPFTFFDARGSTFSQVNADRKLYKESAESKMEKNRVVMDEYKNWKIRQWVEDESIKTSLSVEELQDMIHTKPRPSTWLDQLAEIQAESQAVALGLKSVPQLARERGADAYKVVDEQSKFLEYAKAKNVPIFIGMPGSRSERDNDIDNSIRIDKAEQEESKPNE